MLINQADPTSYSVFFISSYVIRQLTKSTHKKDCVLAAWNTTFQCVEDNLERYATYKVCKMINLLIETLEKKTIFYATS